MMRARPPPFPVEARRAGNPWTGTVGWDSVSPDIAMSVGSCGGRHEGPVQTERVTFSATGPPPAHRDEGGVERLGACTKQP
jgi:hypothetical protein